MEKLKGTPFVGLRSTEQLRNIYRQTYRELEAGDRIILSHFDNFKAGWRQVKRIFRSISRFER